MNELDAIVNDLEEIQSLCCEGVTYKNIETLIEKIRNRRFSGWIPVKEGLPEKNGFYQVTEKFVDKIVVYQEYYFADRKEWSYRADVIAWQPLPEPYKEE